MPCCQPPHPPALSPPAVEGLQNYSCDPIRGQYEFLGWLVNGTETMSDKFGGEWAKTGPQVHLVPWSWLPLAAGANALVRAAPLRQALQVGVRRLQ